MLGRPSVDVLPTETAQQVLDLDRRTVAERRLVEIVEQRVPRSDDRPVVVRLLRIPLFDAHDAITHIVAIYEDITQRQQSEARIQRLAYHDALPSLRNRLLFEDRVTQAIAQARRNDRLLAVIFVDIDHFKHVNDSLGHPVGDQVLVSVGDRVQNCLREGDTVARFGGDEFVICVSDVRDSRDAAHIAHKLLDDLDQVIEVGGHQLRITASAGISLYPANGATVESLMRNADTAMYHAKESGRGQAQFYAGKMNQRVQQYLLLGNRLRSALEQQQFEVHYQPQVQLQG